MVQTLIDPTEYHVRRGRDLGAIMGACGIIPDWVYGCPPEMKMRDWLSKVYAHGGGWNPFDGFKFRAEDGVLEYPEDPPIYPYASFTGVGMGERENVYVYPHAWVAIQQPDGSVEIARMD